MRVEIASDVVCPWCYIGKRRFDKAVARLAETGTPPALQVRYRAYQLDPTAPLNQPEPVVRAYSRRFGGADRAQQILTDVSRVAGQEGLEFNMNIAVRANTLRAHRLLKIVEAEAAELQAAVNETVMQAYFCDGKDISMPDVLAECAKRGGFWRDDLALRLEGNDEDDPAAVAVNDDFAWAREHDITAVPTFVINDSFAIPGAQDTDTFVRILSRLIEQ